VEFSFLNIGVHHHLNCLRGQKANWTIRSSVDITGDLYPTEAVDRGLEKIPKFYLLTSPVMFLNYLLVIFPFITSFPISSTYAGKC